MYQKFKTLTFICLLLGLIFPTQILAKLIEQQQFANYLRWSIYTDKETLKVNFKKGSVTLATLDSEFFNRFAENIVKIAPSKRYIKDFKFSKSDFPGGPQSLEIIFDNEGVDAFSFYQDSQNKLIVDFWANNKEPVKVVKKEKAPVVEKSFTGKKIIKSVKKLPVKHPKVLGTKVNKEKFISNTDYRDFRYGANKIWAYPAHIPDVEVDINTEIKAPDYLYTIKDAPDVEKAQNAHFQLCLNFYKKQKWGLMARSINLYLKKYGEDKNIHVINFMKAVSLIKNTINQKVQPKLIVTDPDLPPEKITQQGTISAALNILENISEQSDDYLLIQAALRYELQYARNTNDKVKSLQIAKRLYVHASENFDDAMIIYSSKVILNSLAYLGQMKKIQQFLDNKAVKRLLPKLEGFAYQHYLLHKKNNYADIIEWFEKNRKSFMTDLHPTIIFAAAESYFQKGKYDKSLELFDLYIANFGYSALQGNARLRVALIYDLRNEDPTKVLKLYRDAIDLSSDARVSYEARLRYIGLGLNRKKVHSNSEEFLVFFNKSAAQEKVIEGNLAKLLWSVRLRSFLAMKQYDKALAYLENIPLDSMNVLDRTTYELDGTEAVLGVMQNEFKSENYARVAKIWEIYREQYPNKIDTNPYCTFLAATSYLRLKLSNGVKSTENSLNELKNGFVREFPIWVDTPQLNTVKDYLAEINIMKFEQESDWDTLLLKLKTLNKTQFDKVKGSYYQALALYKKKEYEKAVKAYEEYISNGNLDLSENQKRTMLLSYVESLYEVGDQKRFQKNSEALLSDLASDKDKESLRLQNRIRYLLIESYFSMENTNLVSLEEKGKDYLKTGLEAYKHRVRFITAVAQLKQQKKKEGKSILQDLIQDESTPNYIKELARSELVTLEIQGRNL